MTSQVRDRSETFVVFDDHCQLEYLFTVKLHYSTNAFKSEKWIFSWDGLIFFSKIA